MSFRKPVENISKGNESSGKVETRFLDAASEMMRAQTPLSGSHEAYCSDGAVVGAAATDAPRVHSANIY